MLSSRDSLGSRRKVSVLTAWGSPGLGAGRNSQHPQMSLVSLSKGKCRQVAAQDDI
jgi:hypothetical protein